MFQASALPLFKSSIISTVPSIKLAAAKAPSTIEPSWDKNSETNLSSTPIFSRNLETTFKVLMWNSNCSWFCVFNPNKELFCSLVTCSIVLAFSSAVSFWNCLLWTNSLNPWISALDESIWICSGSNTA